MARSQLKNTRGLAIRPQKQRDQNAMASVQVYKTAGSDNWVNPNDRFKVILHNDGKGTVKDQTVDRTKFVFNDKAYQKEVDNINAEFRVPLDQEYVQHIFDLNRGKPLNARVSEKEQMRRARMTALNDQLIQQDVGLSNLNARKYRDFTTKPNPNWGKVTKTESNHPNNNRVKYPGGGLFGRTIENVTRSEMDSFYNWLDNDNPNNEPNPLLINKNKPKPKEKRGRFTNK